MAVRMVVLNDIVENCKWMMQDQLGLEIAVASLTAVQVLNPAWYVTNLTTDEINAQLKHLTGYAVGTDTDLNAYPLGYATGILFDLNGDPVI